MALGLREHQLVVVVKVCTMAECRKTVLIGAVLEKQVSCILVNLLVFRSQSDITLQVEEGFVRVALDLQALSALEVRLSVFLVEVGGYSEILDGLTKIAKDGEDKPPEVEVLGDVVFALLDGLIDVGDRLVEVVPVEVEDGAEVVEGRDVIVGELG